MNGVRVGRQLLNVPCCDAIPPALDAVFRLLQAVDDTVLDIICCSGTACHALQFPEASSVLASGMLDFALSVLKLIRFLGRI